VLRERRAFLLTLAGSLVALGVRAASVPRGLTDQQIAALEQDSDDYDLSGSMPSLNGLARELELGPQTVRFGTFGINTVERQPERGLDRERWSVGVDGLVGQPLHLSAESLADLPRIEQISDFHCVEGWGVRDVAWQGVRLRDLLEQVQPSPDARFVTFSTLGGVYTDSLSLDQARRPDTLLATHLDGQPLPDRQGYPLRLVVPSMYGYKSVKWLARIQVEARRHVGFWERRGWQLDPYV
jgi:DMSO/TMAO reductase YedYZ molybdopterin-dependent catalytic subunit